MASPPAHSTNKRCKDQQMPSMPKLPGSKRRENPEAVMSLGDHLREARDRAIKSALAIFIGAIVGYLIYDPLFEFIARPITVANANGANLSINFSTILSSFDLRLRISIWAGVVLASPIWLYQFWAYVAPGMTRKERAYAWAFGGVGAVLFLSGVALGMWIMPHAAQILTGFIPSLASTSGVMDASTYLSFYLRLVLVFGIAFLLPELMVALNRLGLLKGETMLKGWRWAVLLIFTFMAFANPLPDPWSMILMALPITGLYFLACWISIRHDKAVARKRAKLDAELDAALAEPAKTPAPAAPAVAAAPAAPQVEAAPAAPAVEAAPAAELTPALEASSDDAAEAESEAADEPAEALAADESSESEEADSTDSTENAASQAPTGSLLSQQAEQAEQADEPAEASSDDEPSVEDEPAADKAAEADETAADDKPQA